MTLTLARQLHFRPQYRYLADGALLCLTLSWGATFVPVKAAVYQFPVLGFIGLRFFAGMLALTAPGLLRVRRSGITVRQIAQAVVTGWIFLAGYAFQTFGLRLTATGRAAFITGLNTVLVPLILVVVCHEKLRPRPVWGAVLATFGVAALGWDGWASGSITGDLLVFCGAAAFATHVVLTGRWGQACDPVLFTLIQVAAVVPMAIAGALWFEGGIPPLSPYTAWAAVLIGVVVTGLGLLVQVWAQRTTSPTHTAVIFATEPVFGAFFGWLLAGEVLSLIGWGGCALILAGMLVAESG